MIPKKTEDKGELLRKYLEGREARIPSGFGWRKMRCINPEHQDRNPSASVNLQKGRYNCFACGLSGDVFDLAHTLDGLTYREASAILGFEGTPSVEEPTWI